MSNVHKFKKAVMAAAGITDYQGNAIASASGGADNPFTTSQGATVALATEEQTIRKSTFTMAGTVTTVPLANGGWNVKIGECGLLEQKFVVGALMDLTDVTLGGGYTGAETFQMSVGSTANTNSSLVSTELWYVNNLGGNFLGSGLTGRSIKHASWDGTSDAIPDILRTNLSQELYLNSDGFPTGTDGTITVNTGTITIIYVDVS